MTISNKNTQSEFEWDDLDVAYRNGRPPRELVTEMAERQIRLGAGLHKPCDAAQELLDQWQADNDIAVSEDTDEEIRWLAMWREEADQHDSDNVVDISEPLTRECEENGAARRQADDVDNPVLDDHPKLNDAVILGVSESPEAQAALNTSITIMRAGTRLTAGRNWTLNTGTVGQLIDNQLSNHPVVSEKDGVAFVYASGVEDRTTDVTYGQRIQNSIESVNAIAGDIDGTDKARRVAERIHELGLMGVVYTTHSHDAKKTETCDRFRFIIFLEEPIHFPDAVRMVKGKPRPKLTEARRKAVAEYHDRYAGLCDLLGIDEIDASAMNLHQMMYTPRRPFEDAEFEHYVIYGKALRYEDVPVGDASKYRKEMKAPSGAMLSKKDSSGPAVLSDGFFLAEWWGDGGRHLILADVLDSIGWDVRGGYGWTEIMCPNAALHSDPNDDAAAFSEGEDGFAIHCFHDHCSQLGTWQFLVLIEQAILDGEAVLPDGVESFSALLCDPAFYPDEIDGDPVEFDRADFIKQKATSFSGNEIETGVTALNRNSGDDEIATVIQPFIDQNADENTFANLKDAVANEVAMTKPQVGKLIKDLRADARKQKKTARTGKRPAKYLSNNFQEDCDEISKIMTDQGDNPQIFHSNERLVDIQIDQNGNAYMRTIEKDRYKAKLENRMDFIVVNEDGTEHSVEAPPPKVNNSYHRPKDDYPPLHRVISAPVFAPDMSLIDKPGYHDSGVYYQPNEAALTLAGVSPFPTYAEVKEAVLLIVDLIGDFCLDGMTREELIAAITAKKDVPSFCHVLSSGLTPLSRAFIDGPTPGHFARKDKPRTGATLLMSNFQYIATLAHVAATALPSDIAEIQKTLTAMADSGALAFLFDNLSPNVDAAELAMALTAWPFYGGRRLNVTEMIRVTILATWLFTGNRTAFSEELTERMLLIVLDPKTSQPGKRPASSFKHPRFTDHVMQNAGKYLHALLTIVQNWIAQGCPEWEGDALGGFENHSYIIGGILEAAGIRGFLSNHTVLSEQVSGEAPEDALMDALIEAHHATPKGKDGTLFRACSGDDTTRTRIVDGERRDNPHAGKRVLSIMDILTAESIPLDKVGYAQTEDGGLFYPPKAKNAVASRIANLAGSEDGVGGIVREWGSDREEVEARQGRYILQRAYNDKHGVLYRLERLPLFSNG